MELDEARLRNWFRRFQVNPPDCEPVYVHASGHASRAELKELIYDLKPQAVYPIHTEHPEMFADIIPSETKLVEPETGRHYLI
jgi:ribonuclease J